MLRSRFPISAAFVVAAGLVCAQEGSRSVWDGVYSDDQARRGQALYQKHCANCHGESLAGGESAPPLAGGEFLSTWDGLTLGDLLERIRKTMPVDKPRSLSREIYVDTLAHILASNKFPAGAKDLPQETERLSLIKVEQTKH
jgi:mono/diheme cytochrome c family protein